MKVLIDISNLNKLSLSRGIGVYAKNLYSSLKKIPNLEIDLKSENPDYEKYDLVHFPYFDFLKQTLKPNFKIPFVVTIHDLIPIMFSSHYPSGIKGKINWHFQKENLKKANSIISVSKTVKKDIEKILKIDESKINVVYSAPSDNFRKIPRKELLKTQEKFKLPKNFVLYIGNVNWNKNIVNITEGVLKANKKLVIIGSAFLDKDNLIHPEKKSFKTWIEKYENNSEIIRLGFIEDEDMVKILNLADCLVFASYYEGFGLPILEAQKCEVPVITSNISGTAEIAGKGALLVDPNSTQEITDAIGKISESRNKLIKEGIKNLENFSWERTAKETFEVYKNALK